MKQFTKKIKSFIWNYKLNAIKNKFLSFGINSHFYPNDIFTYQNISIGDNVSIGYGADFVATRSKIIIKDHVLIAPKVSIRGGNHRIDIIGRYMDSITDKEKLPENDKDVIFEGDNWVGMNVTILHGVTIGRGSVIAAGSVVTKNVPPYSIFGGVPGKVLKYRYLLKSVLNLLISCNSNSGRFLYICTTIICTNH